MSKSQVFVVRRFWVFCRNVSRTFVELCVETPYWCTVLVHQYRRRKSTKTSGIQKLFLFTRQLAYVRINISSNTWNGYAAENQEEIAFLFWCHALQKLGCSNCRPRIFLRLNSKPFPYLSVCSVLLGIKVLRRD